MNYRQCLLARKIPEGEVRQYSWIPEPFCVKGKTLKLKEDGVWTDGWKVLEAWEPKPAEWVEAHERDYTKNRKASDI